MSSTNIKESLAKITRDINATTNGPYTASVYFPREHFAGLRMMVDANFTGHHNFTCHQEKNNILLDNDTIIVVMSLEDKIVSYVRISVHSSPRVICIECMCTDKSHYRRGLSTVLSTIVVKFMVVEDYTFIVSDTNDKSGPLFVGRFGFTKVDYYTDDILTEISYSIEREVNTFIAWEDAHGKVGSLMELVTKY
jgi:hypothetical protein